MEKTSSTTLITTDESVLCSNLLTTPLRLTPTGKVSHAKTRVYIQRYRKEWEQLPDFKGWLTSVPFQSTRAYCIYCKKNLHAHRLSLLKHTCTMKHQRAAMIHITEKKNKQEKVKPELPEPEETTDNPRVEEDYENEEEVEYVVERLEMDEDEAMESVEIKDQSTDSIEELEKEVSNELCAQLSDAEDHKSVIKKIKLSEEKCRDTLAEAMAHVHNEYLEEETEENVQMEVEEDISATTELQAISILPEAVENTTKEKSKELHESEKVRSENKSDKKSGKVLEDSKANLVVTSLPILGTTYQISTSSPATQNTITMTPMPIAPVQNKTITLTSGGKILTLTGGTFQPGTQYMFSKIKGKFPTLVVADKKPIVTLNQTDASKPIQVAKVLQSPIVPGTSQQQSTKKVKSDKSVKPVSKKLRISTHVVDTTKGLPIGGLQVSLYKLMDGRWTFVNESNTNSNGRCVDLLDNAKFSCSSGRYKIHFDVAKYFTLRRIETVYPFIEIALDVKNPIGHYHIPIFLSPFGFSTYRTT